MFVTCNQVILNTRLDFHSSVSLHGMECTHMYRDFNSSIFHNKFISTVNEDLRHEVLKIVKNTFGNYMYTLLLLFSCGF
jgi:hypothetical protein